MSFQNTAPGAAAADQPAGEGPTAPVVSPVGHVTLVGAGPGNPELLTRKAYRALQNATLVLYDHLVGPAVLDCIAPGAEAHLRGQGIHPATPCRRSRSSS